MTIKQPWAELIASGRKSIETRSWPTRYRGPLAIHAGLQGDRDAARRLGYDLILNVEGRSYLPRGAVVAVADLVDVRRLRPADAAQSLCAHVDGRYAWILADIQRLEPVVPRVGAQGLWRWTP
ncbi:MAG: ASCH domain-containing protein [Thermoplasmatota archaeon]